MRAPVVAVGDGALGFWAAVRHVWPKTRAQRGSFHKLGNILDKLPRRLQPRAKAALHEVMYAETREQARETITRFATVRPEVSEGRHDAGEGRRRTAHVLRFPRRALEDLRTSNVIESPFAMVRSRERVTKGAGSRTKALLMAYKLLAMAQARWRRLDGAHLLPLVRDGVAFVDGVQQASRRGRPGRAPRRESSRLPIHVPVSTRLFVKLAGSMLIAPVCLDPFSRTRTLPACTGTRSADKGRLDRKSDQVAMGGRRTKAARRGSDDSLHPLASVRASRRAAWPARQPRRSPSKRIELPLIAHTLERVASAVDKRQPRTRHEVLHGARNEHLARTGERSDAGSDVDRNAADVVSTSLDLSGVKADPHLHAESSDAFADLAPG
jgi:hypothetical protein